MPEDLQYTMYTPTHFHRQSLTHNIYLDISPTTVDPQTQTFHYPNVDSPDS